jgi:hypothetical protein
MVVIVMVMKLNLPTFHYFFGSQPSHLHTCWTFPHTFICRPSQLAYMIIFA